MEHSRQVLTKVLKSSVKILLKKLGKLNFLYKTKRSFGWQVFVTFELFCGSFDSGRS